MAGSAGAVDSANGAAGTLVGTTDLLRRMMGHAQRGEPELSQHAKAQEPVEGSEVGKVDAAPGLGTLRTTGELGLLSHLSAAASAMLKPPPALESLDLSSLAARPAESSASTSLQNLLGKMLNNNDAGGSPARTPVLGNSSLGFGTLGTLSPDAKQSSKAAKTSFPNPLQALIEFGKRAEAISQRNGSAGTPAPSADAHSETASSTSSNGSSSAEGNPNVDEVQPVTNRLKRPSGNQELARPAKKRSKSFPTPEEEKSPSEANTVLLSEPHPGAGDMDSDEAGDPNEPDLTRRERKNNREKQRRSEVNVMFERLNRVLGLPLNARLDKISLLSAAIETIEGLKEAMISRGISDTKENANSVDFVTTPAITSASAATP
jgi:hypothetical protein